LGGLIRNERQLDTPEQGKEMHGMRLQEIRQDARADKRSAMLSLLRMQQIRGGIRMTFNKDYPKCMHCGKKFQTTEEGIEHLIKEHENL
jgi:hypothetical protein